jgi:hydroxyacylglutathione hydrolase
MSRVVRIVRALKDNFSYLIIDESTRQAACVDPANPAGMLSLARSLSVNLSTVLTTHHHADHSGGNLEMAASVPGLEIVGGVEAVPGATRTVKDGESFALGSLTVHVLHVPCHTRGHVVYRVVSPGQPDALFTGDTLFVGGCGRFFEGTAQEMQKNMDRLAELDGGSLVFCGHEYAVANLTFALSVEPSNRDIELALTSAREAIAAGGESVPSTIEKEKRTNPFMRTRILAPSLGLDPTDPAGAMAALRERKNNF